MPISNFKAHPESPFCPQLVSASAEYIAYVVGRKKVRLLAQDKGQRGAMEQQSSNAQGGIVSLGLKGDTLASLTDAGELLIGSVYEEGKEALGFDPIVALTFPDLNPARGLSWASGERKVLAAWGQSAAAFLVWLEPKPMAVEIPHNLPGAVESVTFFGKGRFLAVADLHCVECFELDHAGKSFAKVAVFSFGPQLACRRVSLFEDQSGEADFVIGAFSGSPAAFMACPVRLGGELAWMRSAVQLPDSHLARAALVFDPLLQVFILDARDGGFTVLGLRSDAPAFALLSGRWREAMAVHSMVLCPELRDVAAGVHVPLYVFQSQWVSFYGLRLPAVNDAPKARAVKAPPVVPVHTETPSPQLLTTAASGRKPVVKTPSTVAPSNPPSLDTAELREAVRSVFMEHAVPAIEAACAEMLAQVKTHLAAITGGHGPALLALDAKLSALTGLVQELSGRVDALPSAEQLSAALSGPASASTAAGSSPATSAFTESAEDLQRRELEEALAEGVAPSEVLVRALGLGSLDVLASLLPRLSPEVAIEGLPPAACLSLAQQLGADLGVETEMKLDWLAELFTAFCPPRDASAAFVGTMAEVLEELFANLRGLAIQIPESEPSLARKTKLVMRLIRTLL